MEILLQRVADLATLLATPWRDLVNVADGVTRPRRWAVEGPLWLVLLLLPGSFLLLPALLWWKYRRVR